MEEKIFFTFESSNPLDLNTKISQYAEENGYKEINRSAPAIACYNGYFSIVVTSTFIVKPKDFCFENNAGHSVTSGEITKFITKGEKR